MQLRIGIDLGGTKIEVIALGAAGQELALATAIERWRGTLMVANARPADAEDIAPQAPEDRRRA